MRTVALLILALLAAPSPAAEDGYARLPGGAFRSAIRYEENGGNLQVPAFSLAKHAVTNGQFLAFVQQQPQWRRDRVPALFTDAGYLAHWRSPTSLGAGAAEDGPVTHVSWYAADAYCKAQGGRLPQWAEWEYAAAADGQRHDARGDATWRARLFDDGTPRALDASATAAPNAYGVSGLHGAVWEWTDDFSALLSGADKRAQDDGDRLKFCGATALAFNDRGHYAVLKRIALLSALRPQNTLGNLGFRCARNSP